MIKAVFFDIDGTLLNSNAKTLASTKMAIKALQKNGILCGVATGRGPFRLNHYIGDLNLDFFVTYNGQLVYTPTETIYQQPISTEMIHKLANYSDEFKRQLFFGGRYRIAGSSLMLVGQKIWLKKLSKFLPKNFPVHRFKKIMQGLSRNKGKKRYSVMSILNEPIYQCVMLSPESETEKFTNLFEDCDFTRSNPYTVDIVPKGGSKVVGIREAGQHFGISLSEVMAFGDSWNDTDMILSVGVGVAMGNGMPEIREIADYVTDTNDKDGIYKALKFYKLI